MAKELYVGHISESATEEDIVRLFSVMGTVTSIHLIIDPVTKEFKRCGYVRMAASVDPDEVVETLDGALLHDQQITVSIARPKKPGMSKGRPARFGGPKRAATGAGPKTFAEARTKPERRQVDGGKPRGASSFTASSEGPKPGGGQRPGRAGKPSPRPPRPGGRKK